ncbi:hypothetical protein NS220_06805 [Microbacterium testaceum]|uniref:Uncharacterized protein n=1 Tax=Microbacterium testaceum TaxID=2033 RepID=A0A147EYB6_MICTE|nr:hypothetical protein [Microbacterium testaceum]KTR95175.1 hypothetical protein NS220_06805 [Microbacterium testaceum]
MLPLVHSAVEGSSSEASVISWIPLIVGLFVLAASLWTSWWGTRGESASLRRLKLMNEAIAGLPTGSDAHKQLEEARDRLAARISSSDVKQAYVRDTSLNFVPIVSLLATVGAVLWLVMQRPWDDAYIEAVLIIALVAALLFASTALLVHVIRGRGAGAASSSRDD